MFNFIERITAFIVSVLVMIFGIPTDFNPIDPPNSIETEKIEIISNN